MVNLLINFKQSGILYVHPTCSTCWPERGTACSPALLSKTAEVRGHRTVSVGLKFTLELARSLVAAEIGRGKSSKNLYC